MQLLSVLALLLIYPASAAHAQEQTPTPTPQPSSYQLYGCWSMDETSGTRYDSTGISHLTDNNTVGYTSGKWGNAAAFIAANSEYLSVAHNAFISVQGSDTWTWAAWIRLNRSGVSEDIIVKAQEFAIYRTTDSQIKIYFYNGVILTISGAPQTNTWHYLVVWDGGANAYAQLNNGTIYSSAEGVYSNSQPLKIGGNNTYFDGAIDELAFWKRALTDAERNWLWNGGNGRPCSQIVSASSATQTPETLYERRVELSSGDEFLLSRSASYGDIAVASVGLVMVVIILIAILLSSVDRWFP